MNSIGPKGSFDLDRSVSQLKKDLGPSGQITYNTAFLAEKLFQEISSQPKNRKLKSLADKITLKAMEKTTQIGFLPYLNKICSAIRNFFLHWNYKEAVSSDHLLLRTLSPEKTKSMLAALMGWHDKDPPVPYQDCYHLVADIRKFFLTKDAKGNPLQGLKDRGFEKGDIEEISDQVVLLEELMKGVKLDNLPDNLKLAGLKSFLQGPIGILEEGFSELDKLKSLFTTKDQKIKKALQSYVEQFVESSIGSIGHPLSPDLSGSSDSESGSEDFVQTGSSHLVLDSNSSSGSSEEGLVEYALSELTDEQETVHGLIELVSFCSVEKQEGLIKNILVKLENSGSQSLISAVSQLDDLGVSKELSLSDDVLGDLMASFAKKISQADFTQEIAGSLLDILSKSGKAVRLFKEALLTHPATQTQVGCLWAACRAEEKQNRELSLEEESGKKIENLGEWRIDRGNLVQQELQDQLKVYLLPRTTSPNELKKHLNAFACSPMHVELERSRALVAGIKDALPIKKMKGPLSQELQGRGFTTEILEEISSQVSLLEKLMKKKSELKDLPGDLKLGVLKSFLKLPLGILDAGSKEVNVLKSLFEGVDGIVKQNLQSCIGGFVRSHIDLIQPGHRTALLVQLMRLVDFCDDSEETMQLFKDIASKLSKEEFKGLVNSFISLNSQNLISLVPVLSEFFGDDDIKELMPSLVKKIREDFTKETAESLLDMSSSSGTTIDCFKEELIKQPVTLEQLDHLSAACQAKSAKDQLRTAINSLGEWKTEKGSLVKDELKNKIRIIK